MAPEVGTQVGIEGRDASIPADLVAYVNAGHPIRSEPTDPMPGRCGSEKNRAGKTPYCERAAGFGTKHQGIGRCKSHDKGATKFTTGLAPWLGNMSEERWRKMTNARSVEPGTYGFQPTHGASTSGLKSFEQILASHLDDEDLQAFLNAPIEPAEVINANLRERFMAKNRIYRYLQRLRLQSDAKRIQLLEERAKPDTTPERKITIDKDLSLLRRYEDAQLIEVEPTLNQNAAVMARLLEVKARFSELLGAEDTRAALKTVLERLSDEDFNSVKSDPIKLALLLSTNPAGV